MSSPVSANIILPKAASGQTGSVLHQPYMTPSQTSTPVTGSTSEPLTPPSSSGQVSDSSRSYLRFHTPNSPSSEIPQDLQSSTSIWQEQVTTAPTRSSSEINNDVAQMSPRLRSQMMQSKVASDIDIANLRHTVSVTQRIVLR